MSLLEVIAEVFSAAGGPAKDGPISRIFMMVVTGVAGICCLVFAYAVISQMNTVGFVVGPFLIVFAGLCFWVFWRQVRPSNRS